MYSGGGLLVNTIAIFASISSDVVATEGLRKFRSKLNQIYWDCCCSDREFFLRMDIATQANQLPKQHWILEPEYKNSRTKVIGNAIADCVTGKNEFKDKDKKPGDIITFEGTNPETYKQKHWNAVILYNYIHEVINGKNESEQVAEVLGNKLEKIKNYYIEYYKKLKNNSELKFKRLKRELHTQIDQAIKYIQEYVDALDLYSQLAEFRNSKQRYDKEGNNIVDIAPWAKTSLNGQQLEFNINLFIEISKDRESYKEIPDKIKIYSKPAFRYHDNKLYIAGFNLTEQDWDRRANNGKGGWDNADRCSYSYSDIQDIEEPVSWLLKRWNGLVELPTENIIENWAKEDKKAKEQANQEQEGRK